MKTTVFMGLLIGTIAVTTLMTIIALTTESVYAQLSDNGARWQQQYDWSTILIYPGSTVWLSI